MAMLMTFVQTKHAGRRYDSWEEFFDDMELMCNNAMEYNADGSQVFQDAQQIMVRLSCFVFVRATDQAST